MLDDILNPPNPDSVIQIKFYANMKNDNTSYIHTINHHSCPDKSKLSIECTVGIDTDTKSMLVSKVKPNYDTIC